jgi:hypothetical protein
MVLIQKDIMCRLNISDVSKQYCPDYKKMRLDLLKEQFVGHCSHGIFITNILEIVQSSQIRTNSKTLDGGMHMDIIARVEGIMYEFGEIIPDAKIAKITDTLAIASSKYASININIGNVNILKVGDITPVIVKIAQYNKYTDKIAIAADLFLPVKPQLKLFIATDNYSIDKDIEILLNKIKECKKELSELSKDASNSLSYFNELIYPYTNIKKWNKDLELINIEGNKISLKINKTNINDLSNEFKSNKIGIFVPDKILLDDSIYTIDISKDLNNLWNIDNDVILITEGTKNDIYKILLGNYYKNLYTLLEFSKIYPDKDSITKSSHIWKFYKMNLKKNS